MINIEDNLFPIKLKEIVKGLDISGFGIFDYYIKSES